MLLFYWEKQNLRVLSLFDGISCGRLALERAEIPVEVYYASEIDKYAIKVSEKNYPDIIRLGDIREIDFSRFIGKIDLIIGGSPCQDLSIAKKNRQGLEGEKSGLFWKFVEAVKTIKPKYFMLENVASMSKENKQIITDTLGIEPILINSALVSAQQRKRLYWCNWAVEQPEDKGIVLKDVLETGHAWSEKSVCITANYNGAHFPHDYLFHQRQMVAENIEKTLLIQENTIKGYTEINKGECFDNTFPNSQTRRGRKMDKKANCLTAVVPQFFQYIGCAFRSRGKEKHLEVRKDEKANALTSVMTDSAICKPLQVGCKGKDAQANRIYSVRGKSVCLNANGGGGGAKTGLYKIDLPDGDYYVRKLTPVECERLQTLPDNYTDCVSKTQRYKSIGNAWTVDVIAHIFGALKKEQEKA
ncbi:MAG: DNA (cytosine-5-)-methyltransferase [Alphaproteobacteria bacterium]|nr:DNA (cytosine-5-)-methyltransferase [Alphaproteobacteria bacterium]